MSRKFAASISIVVSGVVVCAALDLARPVEAKASSASFAVDLRFLSEMSAPASAEPMLFQAADAQPAQPNSSALPDGKGKDVTQKDCSACHAVNVFSSKRNTRAEWSQVIDDMVNKGLDASDDDIAIITDYLATNLGPAKKDQPPPPAAPANPPSPPPNP